MASILESFAQAVSSAIANPGASQGSQQAPPPGGNKGSSGGQSSGNAASAIGKLAGGIGRGIASRGKSEDKKGGGSNAGKHGGSGSERDDLGNERGRGIVSGARQAALDRQKQSDFLGKTLEGLGLLPGNSKGGISSAEDAMAALGESQNQFNAYLDTAQNTFGERTNITDDDKRRLEMAGMHLYGSGVYGNGLEDWKAYGEKQAAEIKGRNDQIREYLTANMDKLNPEAVQQIMDGMDAMDKSADDIWRSIYDNEELQAWDKARLEQKAQQEAAEKQAEAKTVYEDAKAEYDDAKAALNKLKAVGNSSLDQRQKATPEELADAQQRLSDADAALKKAQGDYEAQGGQPETRWLPMLSNRVERGSTDFISSALKGIDFLFGDFVDEGRVLADETLRGLTGGRYGLDLNKDSLVDRAIDFEGQYATALDAANQKNVGENDAVAQFASKYTPTVVQAIPNAVLAIMSMGSSAAGTMTTEGLQQAALLANSGKAAQTLLPAARAAGEMLKDPQWAMSFVTTVGNDYEDALKDGASESQAAVYALLSSGINATIEIGGGDEALGGMEKLPASWRKAIEAGDKNALLQMIKSAGGEVLEEIEQGIVSETAKSTYRPIKVEDVLDLDRMREEAIGAAVTSLALGGGQMAATSLLTNAGNKNTQAQAQPQAQPANPVLDLVAGNQQSAAPAALTAPAAPAQTANNPVLDVLQTGEVQSAPETASAAPVAPVPEMTQPAGETAVDVPAAALNTEATPEARRAEVQSRLDEINNQLEAETDPAVIDELYAEGDALLKESQALDRQIEARETQQSRIDNGEVSKNFGTDANHIDNRTSSDMSNPRVKAFQFDHPELHEHFAGAAQELMEEVEYADRLTKSKMYERGTAIDPGPVQDLMNMGLTKPRIIKCLQDIIADNGQENYADAKKVEKVLSDMMTKGWRDLKRADHPANADYIAAKDAIGGGVKADSWEAFLERSALSLATGEVTEEQLLAEWEAQQKANVPSQQNIDADRQSTAQPANTDGGPSAPPTGTGPTLTPTDTTTAESTNGTGNERERGGSANIRTNENAEADLRQSFENAPEMYRQMTNAEVQQKADAIMAKGFDAARSEVEQAIGQAKAGMKLKPEHLVAGFEVANEMTRRGDVDAANRLMADLFAEQTAGGQLGQLGRLLRAQAPATKAQVIQNLVDKMNNALVKEQTRKNVRRGVGDAEGRISVDSSLVEQFANATDEASSDAALDAIQRNIASQIPATIAEKFTALRYLNMLGNIKTQGRNIVGNTAMMLTTDAKRTVQAVNELVASAVSGGKYERNTSLFTSKDLRRQAAADFEANIDEIKGESKYSDASRKALQGVQEYRTIFDFKPLEGARRLTNWAMDAGDVIFMRHTYVQSFAGWMKAHGVTDTSTATQEQIQKARAFAAKEAQEATFHDNNAVSNWVSGLGRGENTPAIVNTLAEGIMPFRKTPANVAVRAVEYSPVGLAETIYKGVQAARGKGSTADFINSLSKTATGSALAVAGYFLAAAGQARGSGNDEDDELNNFQKMQGAADYSVKIGDSYVSLSQFAPMAIPFFMGVKLQELIENSDEPLSLDSIGDILGIISDPMLEMSMLSGVNDTLSNVASLSGDTDAIPSLVANAALGYLSQGLTNSLLGQAEQAWERNRQTTYTDTKSEDATVIDQLLGKGQYKLGQYAAKIPGVDYNQQDYVDAWGRTRDNGSVGERLFNAFLNPTYVTDDSSTEVDAELERLHNDNRDVEDFPEVFPQKRARSATIGDGIVMTPDEYLQFSKDSGQMKLSLVKDFIGSEQYQGLTDEQRAKVISDLYSLADDRALQRVKDGYGIETQSDLQKLFTGSDKPGTANDVPALDEKNAGEYVAFHSLYGNMQKNGDYAGLDNLLAGYGNLDSNTRAVIEEKGFADLKNLLSFADAGSGAESYYKLKEAIGDAQWNLDVSSAQGGHVRLAGLGTVDLPDAEKDNLVESGAFKLSGTAKSVYDILRGNGFSPADASAWFEGADWYSSGKDKNTGEIKPAKADGSLNAYEVATAISKIPNLTDSQRETMYKQFKSALQKEGDLYDTWKSKSYTQALRQSTSWNRITGRDASPGNASRGTTSQNQSRVQEVWDLMHGKSS